ncbi:related to phospholipid-translocating ATPase [Rhynchosporium graminicola]|uniref:Related to phospholipid-translocating ATPase n=1 Tax=Rhynchosporium graminicola TaxID=2792576 RepID=A0A1E1KDW0_9HELO|nr:related to phospholipid-translocating ATPase [Rhynchosporium commune]
MTSTTSFSSSTTTFIPSSTASCIRVPPGKNGYVPAWACDANYSYNPSFAGAIVFAIIFGICLFLHIFQAIHYSKNKLCWTLIMGVLWEFASFSIRTAGTRNQQSTPLAFASQILVLLAPMWINAFVYMVLGRMVYFFVPAQEIFRIKGIKIAKIFVWLDVLSFFTQVGGGVLIEPTNSAKVQMMGIHIYMGGIGFQELCILIFTAIAVRFAVTMSRLERSNQIMDGKPKWRTLLSVLFAALILITIRIIFRMVEFASGLDPAKNPIPYHEAYFMVLDALPMLVAGVLFNIVHPGRVLRGEGSEFPRGPSRKEKKEIKTMKKEEKIAKKAGKKGSLARGQDSGGVEMV